MVFRPDAAMSALGMAERGATRNSIPIAKCCQRCNAGESGVLTPLRNGVDRGDDAQVLHGDAPLLGENENCGQYSKQANEHKWGYDCQCSQGDHGKQVFEGAKAEQHDEA